MLKNFRSIKRIQKDQDSLSPVGQEEVITGMRKVSHRIGKVHGIRIRGNPEVVKQTLRVQ